MLLTVDIFTNPLGGDWSVGSNWSLGAPPTSTQDATVTPGSDVTVTHSSSDDTVHTLTSDGSLLISGGSLSVTGDLGGTINVSESGQLNLSGGGSTEGDVTIQVSAGAVVDLSGSLNNTGQTLTVNGSGTLVVSGTLTGGTVALTNGATIIGQGGTLDGVTIDGTATVENGNGLIVTNGITLNGMLTLGSNSENDYGYLDFSGSQTFGGAGSVLFTGTDSFNSLGISSGVLTIGPGITVRGGSGHVGFSPAIGGSASDDTVINQGTIQADVSGATIDVTGDGSQNLGSLNALNGATVLLQGSNWVDSGVNFADAASEFLLEASFSNSGDTFALTGAGEFEASSTISGGTLSLANGAILISEDSTFDGLTLDGSMKLDEDEVLNVKDGLTLNGTITLGDSTGYGNLVFEGPQTLDGSGTVTFGSDSPDNAVLETVGGASLTIGQNITIDGQTGFIGFDPNTGGAFTANVVNLGTIAADVSGGVILIDTATWSSSGTLSVANGGTLILQGTANNTDGTLKLVGSGAGSRILFEGAILGGTVSLANGTPLISLNGTFDGVTLDGSITLDDANGINVQDGLTLNGVITLGDSTGYGDLNFFGTQTLDGNGTVTFGSNNGRNALIEETAGATLTIGPNITVNGVTGYIGFDPNQGGSANAIVVNQGTIDANSSGGTISIDGTGNQNTGSLDANNGATLSVLGTLTNLSTISVDGSSTLSISGTLTGGAITTQSGATIVGGALDGVTVNGDWQVTGSNTVTVTDGLTINGVLTLGAGNGYGVLSFTGSQTFGGAGRVIFGSSSVDNSVLEQVAGATLTIGQNITIDGQTGFIGYDPNTGGSSAAIVVNQGTIAADVSGGDILIDTATWSSSGILSVANGGTLTLSGAADNTGGILTLTGDGVGSSILFEGDVLGGTVSVASGTNLISINGTFDGVTLDGSITLDATNGLNVHDGLTLNGVITLGDSTGYGDLYFFGAQTLDGTGTVIFGSSSDRNALLEETDGAALTIGPNIIIHGQNGYVGFDPNQGGSVNGSVVNQGTIEADSGGGTISVYGTGSLNSGSLEALDGATLGLLGTLTNLAIISIDGSSTLSISGTLTGGAITTQSGATIVGGALDGVTVNGDWQVTGSNTVTVTDGLTINGVLTLGAGNGYGVLSFTGSQTLGGAGRVIFGSSSVDNSVLEQVAGATLTIGQNITIDGQTGLIGYDPNTGGSSAAIVVNQGTIAADVSGGDILIDTATWSSSGTLGVANGGTLTLPGIADNTGGTLTLTGDGAGSSILLEGTVLGGTVALKSGTNLISVNGTFDGVTLDGSITLDATNGLNVHDGLTLNGVITLGDSTGYGDVYFFGAQTLDGTGTVIFGSSNDRNALLEETDGAALTIGPNIIIHGQNGYVGFDPNQGGSVNGSVVNQGTIEADSGGGTISVYGTGSLNSGSLEALGGATLALLGTLTNQAIISVDGSSTLSLSGTLTGGAITTQSGATIVGSTLDGVTVNGDWLVANANVVTVTNGLTINGALTLGAGGNYGLLSFNGSQTLAGTGRVTFGSNSADNALLEQVAGATLTIGQNITIDGQTGFIGYDPNTGGSPAAIVVNQGTIEADVSGGDILIDIATWSSSGTLSATNSGTLSLQGTVSNAGGILTLNSSGVDSSILFEGTVVGGTVFLGSGANLISQSGTFDGVTLDGSLTVDADNILFSKDGLTLNGVITLGDNTGFGALIFEGTQTLDGAGTVTFGSQSADNALISDGAATLTVGAGITVNGQTGYIGYSPNVLGGTNNVTVVNLGTIVANSGGGTIVLDPLTWSSSGTLGATNGGTLSLQGTAVNTGNTLTLVSSGAGSSILLDGTVIGGRVSLASGTDLISQDGTFDGVTLDGSLTVDAGTILNSKDGLTLNGAITLGDNNGSGALIFEGTQTLNGAGTVTFGSPSADNALISAGTATLTIGAGITINGQTGYIGYSPNILGGTNNVTVVNLGAIVANASGGTIVLDPLSWSSSGTLGATNGGTLSLQGTAVNTGNTLTLVGSGAGSSILFAGTVVGGTVSLVNGANLISQSGTFDGVTLDGTLTIDIDNILYAKDGLTLNGAITLGDYNAFGENANGYGALIFEGTQTLDGIGTVSFGTDNVGNALAAVGTATLTIGAGITVNGQSGYVGYSPIIIGGTNNITVINQGVIQSNTSVGSIFFDPSTWFNNGTLSATNGGSFTAQGTGTNSGVMEADTGGSFTLQTNEFDLNDGVMLSTSSFVVNNTFNFNGGTVLNPISLLSAQLNIASTATQAASFDFFGSGNSVTGDLGVGQSIIVETDDAFPQSSLDWLNGLNNSGLLGIAPGATVTVSGGTLINNAGGVITGGGILDTSGIAPINNGLIDLNTPSVLDVEIQPSSLQITYTSVDGMDAATITDLTNYNLIGSGGDGVFGNGNDIDENGLISGVTYDSLTGVATFTFSQDLPADFYQLGINGDAIQDASGSSLLPGSQFFLTRTIQVTPAGATLTLDPSSDTGSPDHPGYTNQSAPTFDVQVNQAGTINVEFDGDADHDQTRTVAVAGVYAFTAPVLADGAYTANAFFTSLTGGIAQSSTTYTVDTAQPDVTSLSPTGTLNNSVAEATITFSEPVDLGTFTPSAITFSGPNGTIGVNQPSLVSGSTYRITFPAQTAEGTYILTIAASVTNFAGTMLNEAFSGMFSIALPDLDLTGASAPPTAIEGASIPVSWTVTNISSTNPARASWTDAVYLSTKSTFDDTAVLLLDVAAPPQSPLEPGASYTRNTSVTIPASAATGSEFLLFIANENGGQAESDSGSNDVAVVPINLTAPDLFVTGVSGPTSGFNSQEVLLTWTDANQGTAQATGPWVDNVYAASDAQGDNPTLLASFAFNGVLAAGASVTRTQQITLPPNAGTYWFAVTTNATESVPEGGNFGNNTDIAAVPTTVSSVPLPDLVVTSITQPVNGVLSGTSVPISFIVTNRGAAPTSTAVWNDWVILSQDPTLGASYQGQLNASGPGGDESLIEQPVVVGFVNPSYLGVGESYQQNVDVTLPIDAEGTWYVYVVPDGTGAHHPFSMPEASRTDKLKISSAFIVKLSPPPDLAVTAVTAPDQDFSGKPIVVSWTVSNQGTGPTQANAWMDAVYMSTDPTVNSSAIELGTFTHQGLLAVGANYTTAETLTLPVGVSGQFYFVVVTDVGGAVFENGALANNTRATTVKTINLTPPPDLKVVSVIAPGSAHAGHSLAFSYQVENVGAGFTPISSWVDSFYLSPTADFNSSTAILLANQAHPGSLAVDQSYNDSINIVLPVGISGSYYILVDTDGFNQVVESNEANNFGSSTAPVQITLTPADLVVSSALAPTTALAGTAILVDWTVTNQGASDTVVSSWQDAVYAEVGSTLDQHGVKLGTFTHAGLLNSGASYTQAQLVTIPISFQGNYNLFVVTNANNAVLESNANNNTFGPMPIAVTLQTPGGGGGGSQQASVADLTVTSVTAPVTASTGGPVTVNWTVQNVGPGPTNSNFWNDDVWMSTNATLQSGGTDIYLGTVRHANVLNSADTYSASGTFTIPNDTVATRYFIIVATDRPTPTPTSNQGVNLVFETNETNNETAASPSTEVSIGAIPDLAVSQIAVPTTATSGGQLALGWTVTNARAATGTAPITDSVYLSYDQNFDPSDRYLGSATRQGGLAEGASYMQKASFQLPVGLAGTFYVFVVTNSNQNVFEQNFANNTANGPQTVQINLPAPADLVAGTVSIPNSGLIGQDFTISYQVSNNGSNPANGSWVDSLYLSSTPTWNVSDPLLGKVSETQDLAPGASYTGTLTSNVPGVAPGSYYVIVRTNILDTLPELTLSNNLSASISQSSLDAPELVLGTPVQGTLTQGQSVYYKVRVLAGQTLEVNLLGGDSGAANELYVSYGAVPSRSQSDYRFTQPFDAQQQILVPETKPGFYYILAYADSLPASSEPYTLTASVVPFGVLSIDQSSVGNTGNVTIGLLGSKLNSATSITLTGPGDNTLTAQSVYVVNGTNVYATFDAAGAPTGPYSLTVEDRSGDVSTLQNALQIVAGFSPPIDVNVAVPAGVRENGVFNAELVYRNTGNVDIVPPIITLASNGTALLGLSNATFGAGDLALLGRSPTGPGGILRPGESVIVTVYVQALVPVGADVTLQTSTVTATNLPIDPNVIVAAAGLPSSPFAGESSYISDLERIAGSTNAQFLTTLQQTVTGLNGGQGNDSGAMLLVDAWNAELSMVGEFWNAQNPAGPTPPQPILTLPAGQIASIQTYQTGTAGAPVFYITAGYLASESYGPDDWVLTEMAPALQAFAATVDSSGLEPTIKLVLWNSGDATDLATRLANGFAAGGLLGAYYAGIDYYGASAANVPAVGEAIANDIVQSDYDPSTVTLVGHNLGAQASIAAGLDYQQLTGKQLDAIEALDPAGPGFPVAGPNADAGAAVTVNTYNTSPVLGEYQNLVGTAGNNYFPDLPLTPLDPLELDEFAHTYYALQVASGNLAPTSHPDQPQAASNVPELAGAFVQSSTTSVIASHDPNTIIGPDGDGDLHTVPVTLPLPYQVHFQNQPSANSPAQKVVVSEQMDSTLDWESFRLGSFGFDGLTFTPPPNTASYQTTVDLTATKGYLVDVTATIDVQTGVATWTLTTIDPNTGEQPLDPAIGFLPPDDGNGSGEAFVNYTILANSTDQTGDAVNAQATVTFDTQPPLDTQAYINTLDSGAGLTSSVSPLPTFEPSSLFNVSWSGTDSNKGSAISNYDIYVSVDGGPFNPWLENTTLTTAAYQGQIGHSYGFFSIATDNAGNVETAPSAAQATTTVESTTTITLASDHSSGAIYGQAVTFTASVAADEADAGTPTGTLQFLIDGVGRGAPVTLTAGSAALVVSDLSAGTHTISALYTSDSTSFQNSQPPSALSQPIAPATLTVTANDASRTFGAANPAFSDKISGFVNGDTSSVVSGFASLTTPATPGSNVGSYAIIAAQGSLSAFNYTFAFQNGSLLITPAAAANKLSINPDTGVSASDGITDTGAVALAGNLTVTGMTVDIFDTSTNQDLGNTTVTGTTFLGTLSLAEGSHVLRVRDLAGGGLADAFFTVLVDSTVPTSRVLGSLGQRQTTNTFTVPVTFSDPAGAGGAPASGVSSVDLYDSVNGGPFTLYQTMTMTPTISGTLEFSFTGADRVIYAFYAIAHDAAGLQESKSAIEASTYLPDLHPPVTQVLNSSSYASASGVFTLNWSGTDSAESSGTPPGSIVIEKIFVIVDGGAPQLVAQVPAGNPTGGVYSGVTSFNALADGTPHSYGFYSIGIDDQAMAQPTPASPNVVFSSISFSAPLTASLVVEKGIQERSFIQYLDVNFNQPGSNAALQSLANGVAGSQGGAFVELEYYGPNPTVSSAPISAVTLFGSNTTVTLRGSDLSIDFGSNSITGAPTTSTGDGWYALGVDPTGNPSNNQVFWLTFYRLLGDVTGDELVSGPVATSGTDEYIVNAARGQTGTLLNGDVNGDGAVNTTDLIEVAKELNHSVGATAPGNFPTFQISAGTPGPGVAKPITLGQVQALVPAAIAAWQKAGVNGAGVLQLQKAQIEVVDLGENILGQEVPGLIEINATGAGYSWNVNAGSPPANQMDLQTVLEHEMGHILGLPDDAQDGGLMDIGLGLGVRRTPSMLDVALLDQALRTAGEFSMPDTLAAVLTANRISAEDSSLARSRAAIELIFSQPLRSTATEPLLQPSSNVTLAADKPGTAIDEAVPARDNQAAASLKFIASAPVTREIDLPVNELGQDELSNDGLGLPYLS